jgi:hypothetical protein
MLIQSRRRPRSGEHGQALLAVLFVLAYMGLVTIAVLGYASATQAQYGRTEQTAKQNASIEGAVDAGLVTAGRYSSLLPCTNGSSSGSGSMTFPASGAGGLFQSPQTLSFSYANCYPNGATGPTSIRRGVLQPACVICTLSNVAPSLSMSGGAQLKVAGPIWANNTISVVGGSTLLQSTKVTTWTPPAPCNGNGVPPSICVQGNSACVAPACSPAATINFSGGAPRDPLQGLLTSPTPPSGQTAISYTCTASPCPAIPSAPGGGYQYVFSSLSVSKGTLTLPGGTYFIEEGTLGGGLKVTGGGTLTDTTPFTSSSTTTFTSTSAKDTANPSTVANSWVGSQISSGLSSGVITANDNRGGFTIGGGWTGGTPAGNTSFTVGGVTIFITCSSYSGPAFSCPSTYQTDTNAFVTVMGGGQMTITPPVAFPEIVLWEYPGPTGWTGSGGVGGPVSITSSNTSIVGTTYAPLAPVTFNAAGADAGMIVVGTLTLSGNNCGGCSPAFGTIPGIGPTAGSCPTFDVTAQAANVSNQYGRALIQTAQCSNAVLGVVNFSYQLGTPP